MLYEVTTFGSYYAQTIINRWTYVSGEIPTGQSGSFRLLSAIGAIPVAGELSTERMLGYIMGQLASSYLLNSVTVRAASDYDVTDFYEYPYTTPMAGSQDSNLSQSPAVAFGFRTNRVRLDIARGTKRFVGVTSSQVTSGGMIAATFLDEMDEIADKMSEVLVETTVDGTITYTPCVVSKLEYTTPKGNRAYKYYPTLAQQMDHVAYPVLWQPYNQTRTQDSRQYGKGA